MQGQSNCDTCDTSSTCLTCASGYGLLSGSCSLCTGSQVTNLANPCHTCTNCATTCDASTECVSCSTGFFYNAATYACSACESVLWRLMLKIERTSSLMPVSGDSSCLTCSAASASSCTSCSAHSGLFYDSSAHTCASCLFLSVYSLVELPFLT